MAASDKRSTPKAFRAACRDYAQKQIDLQRSEFKRLGVLGDWDHPYLTMAPRFEAEQLRAFSLIIKNGHVYKGFKPVHWCLNCRSALAEAEVEYEDKTSPSVYVRFEVVDRVDLARRMDENIAEAMRTRSPLRLRFGPRRPGRCLRIVRWRCIRNSTTH